MGSIAKIHEMLVSKQVSCTELTKSYLEEIEKSNGELNAYVNVTADTALETAKTVDEKIAKGEEIGMLEGVPMTLKDNLSTKDIETTCCSKILKGYKPIYNATVWENLSAQNAVMLGKTNMDEFAMGSSCETSCFGGAMNPFNTKYVSGGSSGGVASAVGANIAAYGLGSDTGGSIRQPAALCGVVGLKPTYGSVSRYGLVAFASSLDQIGPLGKSVKDVAMLQSVICGHDRYDATSKNIEYPDYAAGLKENAKGLKIGIPKEYFGEGIDDQVKESVMKAVKELETQGAEVCEISLPSTEYAINTYYIIASAEASSNLARFDGVKYGFRAKDYDGLTDMYEKTRSEGFGDEVKRRIMLGTFVLSSGYFDAYYKKAKKIQKKISQEFSSAFEKCDVIATPTVPASAFKIGENIGDPIKMYYNDVCTVTVNIAGLPAISLPCGKDSSGMPMGLQLIGNKFSEQTLLNTAYTYEKLCGGFDVLAKSL